MWSCRVTGSYTSVMLYGADSATRCQEDQRTSSEVHWSQHPCEHRESRRLGRLWALWHLLFDLKSLCDLPDCNVCAPVVTVLVEPQKVAELQESSPCRQPLQRANRQSRENDRELVPVVDPWLQAAEPKLDAS
eukprot:Skav232080  [mRNA]  locus=scaffold1176:831671:842684:- [translate_table: standard]